MRRVLLAALVAVSGPSTAADEPTVSPAPKAIVASPATAARLALPAGERIVDFEVSPRGGEAAVLVKHGGAYDLRVWPLGGAAATSIWTSPAGLTPRSVTWHPAAERTVFVLGARGTGGEILRVAGSGPAWQEKVIFRSRTALRRLCVGPRPFQGYDAAGKLVVRHRVFYGAAGPGGTYSIRSVTEHGDAEIQVVGPKASITGNEEGPASDIVAASALPLGFHPGGHLLLWEDGQKAFHVATYHFASWQGSARLFFGKVSGGTITALPNGLGVVQWRSGRPGVDVVLDRGETVLPRLPDVTLVSSPSLTPDGKGLVGLSEDGGRHVLRYELLDVPLHDVANAWMFVEGKDDRERYERAGGLLRTIRRQDEMANDQLYSLYDTEMYKCGGYDSTTPTRPYLVTTDLFWEVFAAAYQGLFIVSERQQAVPAFWAFVERAATSLQAGHLRDAFTAAAALRSGKADPEAARIRGQKVATSSVTGKPFEFGETKPRGHYTGSEASRAYFMAFRYLTEVTRELPDADLAGLKGLAPEVRKDAATWIAAYQPFLAPSRAPSLLTEGGIRPAYLRRPIERPTLFPLAWGFDNEVLLSTVFHPDWPAVEQVKGPKGARLLPSSLDVAAALGSRLAESLLAGEMAAYPALEPVLAGLLARTPRGEAGNLYDRWISALAVQWADDALSAALPAGRALWGAKRLQTGLASWTTLRHATVLVNERTAAECGEGGFEEIVLETPHGAVEPDPATFEAIGGLFDAAAECVKGMALPGKLEDEPLRQGILKRLAESARKTRLFGSLARKQARGEALTPAEYDEILFVGRAAEHNFLVFNSLANEQLALSTPEPISKVVDVAGGGAAPYLLAGVGLPLQWDFLVPFQGRRQIVKGSVYSFHERSSPVLLDDAAWRTTLAKEPRPAWISPFLTPVPSTCPPRSPF